MLNFTSSLFPICILIPVYYLSFIWQIMIWLIFMIKCNANLKTSTNLNISISEIRRILESSIGFATDKDPNFKARDFSNRRIFQFRKSTQSCSTTRTANPLFPATLSNERIIFPHRNPSIEILSKYIIALNTLLAKQRGQLLTSNV